jgi:hypothetical protein
MGCACQQYGKSGVPYPTGKCMVCGGQVDRQQPFVGQIEEESAQFCGCDRRAGWVCRMHSSVRVTAAVSEGQELARMNDDGCPHD